MSFSDDSVMEFVGGRLFKVFDDYLQYCNHQNVLDLAILLIIIKRPS